MFPNTIGEDMITQYDRIKQTLKDEYNVTDSQIITSCPRHTGNGYICNTIEITIFLNPETMESEI